MRDILELKCELPAGETILAGISGGVDSIALLYALMEAGYPVVAGHLDHGIRESSARETQFVRRTAEKLGAGFVSERVDAAGYARESKMSLEEAGRELRYRFLFKAAADLGCKAVAVGHHADDQAETILLHLVRGSGLNGLGGMAYRRITQWHPEIPLVRPLLDQRREALMAYCQERDLPTIEDESNQDPRFLRNRIRHELLPLMTEMNPGVSESLGRMGTIVRGELALLENLTDRVWVEIGGTVHGESVQFSREKYMGLQAGLQRRVMRKAFGLLRPGMVDVGFDLIERAAGAVWNPPENGEIDLAQGLRLQITKESVQLSAWGTVEDLSDFPQLVEEMRVGVHQSGNYPLGSGWILEVVLIDTIDLAEIESNPDHFCAALDLGATPGLITIRRRREGDWIAPLGMGGQRMKVSDLMVNEQIPRTAREAWPIIEYGGEIVWVPGCRSAEQVKVEPDSSWVVRLAVRRRD